VHYFIAKDFALDAETGSYLTYRELIDKGATYTIFSFIIGIIVGTYIEFFYRDAKLNEHQLERLANNCTGRGDFKGAINYLNRVSSLIVIVKEPTIIWGIVIQKWRNGRNPFAILVKL
jgi:hypothetical protein